MKRLFRFEARFESNLKGTWNDRNVRRNDLIAVVRHRKLRCVHKCVYVRVTNETRKHIEIVGSKQRGDRLIHERERENLKHGGQRRRDEHN